MAGDMLLDAVRGQDWASDRCRAILVEQEVGKWLPSIVWGDGRANVNFYFLTAIKLLRQLVMERNELTRLVAELDGRLKRSEARLTRLNNKKRPAKPVRGRRAR